jgi:spermidine/putrescine transport system permease protein
VLLVTLLVVPMLIMLAYSFFRYVDIGVEEATLGLGNWVSFVKDPYYHYALWKTARVALITTVVCVVVGYIPAYVIATSGYPHRLLLLLMPFWISFVIRTMSWTARPGGNDPRRNARARRRAARCLRDSFHCMTEPT